ncbi:MAG: transcriptional regulator [Candidatus Nealsonbacteria bacterium]|nr:MAG: transcriptional regulator [Candidatus Nealsonbacteria bacterium]
MREEQDIEFKKEWRNEHLKTIAGFANTEGGVMYIGIDDNGRTVALSNIKKLLEDIPNTIRNKLQITPSVKIEEKDGREVIEITVNSSDFPIFLDGKIYIRSGSTTQEVKGSELTNFLLEKTGKTWDSLTVDATFDDLDLETFEYFKGLAIDRLPEIKNASYKTIFKNLELITNDEKLTRALILLFVKKPQTFFITAQGRAGRFKTPTEILDTVIADGNLFKQLDTLMDAIKKHLNVKFEIKGIERKDVWDYPLEALREAVINALIHKDYLSTAEIQIKIYDDRLWIWNPGKLPKQLTIESLKTEHSSFPKNPLIASVFYYAGFIERWGSGIKRMIDLCKAQKLPEPEFKEEFGGISVYFHKDIYTEEYLRKLGLNERQIKAVMYVKEKGKITNKEYQDINDVSNKTAYLELSNTVERAILKVEGKGKSTIYTLKVTKR